MPGKNCARRQMIAKVILYQEGTAEELEVAEVTRYMRQKVRGAETSVRGNPYGRIGHDQLSDYARKFAGAKIQDLGRKITPEPPLLPGEIEYERRRIRGQTKSFGIIYDGFYLQRLFRGLLPKEERRLDIVNIIFTNRLLATWDGNNRRYHLRTSMYGVPSVISTSGLVEAPARPSEYYLLKQQYLSFSKDLTKLKDRFAGSFIDYGDERLTEVVKGYALQAVFYGLVGDPFCPDRGCRLYNAHWQAELIFAQLEGEYEFCPRHTKILEEMAN